MPTPEDNPRGTPLNASPPPVTPPSPPLCLVIDFGGGFVPGDDGPGDLPTCTLPVGHDGPHSWEDEPEPLEDEDGPWRFYVMEVVAKYEGSHDYGLIMLRPPSAGMGGEWDIGRAWWADRTVSGVPITVDLTPAEMASVRVGDLFAITLTPFSDNHRREES